jgi:hypothetical protein
MSTGGCGVIILRIDKRTFCPLHLAGANGRVKKNSEEYDK